MLGGALYLWKQRVFGYRWVLWGFVINLALAEIAIIAGWWTAEVGRQPWIVWNVLRTADGVSPTLTTPMVASSLAMFVFLYALLLVLFIYLLNAKIQAGPEALTDVETTPVTSLPDSFREVFRRHPALATAPAADGSNTGNDGTP
jgi:cytochrome d ubiquinol oxidase subunit I